MYDSFKDAEHKLLPQIHPYKNITGKSQIKIQSLNDRT